MISGLRGTINRFGASKVYLDTGGVEYEVQIPLNVFSQLQNLVPSDNLFLHIHHQFMQDEQRLYGFLEVRQRNLFSALLTVKGLGSALALSLLSHLDGPALFDICERGDVKALTHIPRVGKSTAETLIFEINRKKESWKKMLFEETPPLESSVESASGEEELAFQALLQLGYKENQVRSTLQIMRKERDIPGGGGEETGAAEIIKEVLRRL